MYIDTFIKRKCMQFCIRIYKLDSVELNVPQSYKWVRIQNFEIIWLNIFMRNHIKMVSYFTKKTTIHFLDMKYINYTLMTFSIYPKLDFFLCIMELNSLM
jgi:hypothetical protein